MKFKPSKAQPEITVRNLQRKVPVNVVELEKFATKALDLCLRLPKTRDSALAKIPEVSIFVVSDRRIASLHKQFMNESGPTDVITFQHGEIFIGANTAHRQARQFETTLAHELRLYAVHGLLHLHGFEDRNEFEARKMRSTQNRILRAASH